MRTRLRGPALLALILCSVTLSAQDREPPRRVRFNEVPVMESVGPEQLRAMVARLQAVKGFDQLQYLKIPPGLQNQLAEMVRNNPGKSPEELAKQFAEQQGNPQARREMEQLLKRFQEQNPQFDPKGIPPIPKDLPFPPAQTNPPQLQPPPDGAMPIPDSVDREKFELLNRPPFRDLPPWEQDRERNQSAQLAERRRQYQSVVQAWERNIGPIQNTPALRRAIYDLFTNQSALHTDAGSGFDAEFTKFLENADAEGFQDLGASAFGEGGWSLPDLGLKDWKWDSSPMNDSGLSPMLPSSSGWGSFDLSSGGMAAGGSWLSVILFAVVVALSLLLWYFWPKITGRVRGGPKALPGLGPWPIDPRSIHDRDTLIQAFEYLSLRTCGLTARCWNHVTLAAMLRDAVPTAGDLAEPLAKVYAIARYTPAHEPIPKAVIVEARRHLCTLAGVTA